MWTLFGTCFESRVDAYLALVNVIYPAIVSNYKLARVDSSMLDINVVTNKSHKHGWSICMVVALDGAMNGAFRHTLDHFHAQKIQKNPILTRRNTAQYML